MDRLGYDGMKAVESGSPKMSRDPEERSPAADFEIAFRENYAAVFRAAYRVAGSAEDAEDVLQTVFMRLLKRAPDAEPVENLASFLHRAAVNAAVDLVRSRQHARSVPLEDFAPFLADSAHPQPDRARSSAEIRLWLRDAVARLSPRVAEMFVLRFFEGKENPEIARLLNTTPGTVAVTLSRTRDRLEKEFRLYMGGAA